MSTNTVDRANTSTTDRVRRDVRGIPLEVESTYREGDPFIGECPAWCEGGHLHWEAADDRSHFGEAVDIALELMDGDYDRISTTRYVATIRTYLKQHYRETEATVFIARGEAAGLYLTLAEATLLRDRLSTMLEAATS